MKAVLLIHGFATDRDDFARLAPLLSARYDEVACPNLPGHGGDKKQVLDHYQILQFALAAFDRLKSRHKTVDIIGFSMGGALATLLASKREVGRLILLAPANKFFAPYFVYNTVKEIRCVAKHKKAIEKNKMADETEEDGEIGVLSAREMLDDVSDGAKMFLHQLLPRYTLKNVREFKKVVDCCNEGLGEIKIPTLVLWGKIDQLVPYASVKHVKEQCRHKTTCEIVYPDISHMMFYSRAYFRLIHDILMFLEATEPPRLSYNPHLCLG